MSFVAVAVGVGVAGAATSAIGAHQQNKAASAAGRRSKDAAAQVIAHINAAKRMQLKQIGRQLTIEQLKVQHEAERIRGRLRVASAEAGVGMGGSHQALMRQAGVDEAFNLAILLVNFEDTAMRIQSDAEAAAVGVNQQLVANLNSLSLMKSNPLLAGVQGGLGGFTTGLQIGQGVKNIKAT